MCGTNIWLLFRQWFCLHEVYLLWWGWAKPGTKGAVHKCTHRTRNQTCTSKSGIPLIRRIFLSIFLSSLEQTLMMPHNGFHNDQMILASCIIHTENENSNLVSLAAFHSGTCRLRQDHNRQQPLGRGDRFHFSQLYTSQQVDCLKALHTADIIDELLV